MYSKAKIAGHPIHPKLVAFPIAFYTAAFVGYTAFHFGQLDIFWFKVAYVANVAGVLTAALAAVPGFIDWAFGIPTGSPAKMTGLIHMACNVTALLLFGASAFFNNAEFHSETPNAGLGFLLSGAGFLLTGVAGYFGWKMIGIHHVGVELTPEQQRLEPTARDVARKGA